MDLKTETKRKYGLFTSIAMIVGIVIGSGIFFKSDNILVATGGDVGLGVLVFCLAALAIVFGSLTLSELASRTEKPGGIIAYANEFSGEKMACSFGWFQTFIYYPTLVAIVGWVVGIYINIYFGRENTLESQVLIGYAFIIICYAYNILSPRFGGFFQNAAMVIKLIPLIMIAIAGLIFGNPQASFEGTAALGSGGGGFLWLAALGPIAFSFDGWIISTSISHEIKNAKRNLPLALIAAPLAILVLYVLYFVGITSFVGPKEIIAIGDSHVDIAAQAIFGGFGAKLMLIFIIISVMGTVNGVILGSIRLPYSLALRKMLPGSEKLAKIESRLDVPVNSGLFSFAIASFWLLAHYLTQKYNLLPNSDISEIAIAMSYLLYILLYFKVYGLYKAGELKSRVRGIVFPLLVSLGSLIILTGSMQNKLFPLYAGICLAVIGLSLLFWKNKVSKA